MGTALAIAWLPGIAPPGAATSSPDPCGAAGQAPAVQHVVIVMLENRSYTQVMNNPAAPFQNALARECGNATSAFGITHTSASNYLGISGGQYPASSVNGCDYAACATSEPSIYSELDSVGRSWKAYVEAMPSACDTASAAPYKIGHNPPIFFTGIGSAECAARDVGVPSLTASSGAFWNDLQAGTLPSLSWVSPSTANDGENSCGGNCALSIADRWLQNFLGLVQASSAYQSGTTLVLVTYDEGTGHDNTVGEDCANQAADLAGGQPSCHVPLLVVYPFTQPTADSTFFDGYSITKTVEDLFQLPYLGHAADPGTVSLVGHFGIP